MEEPQAGALHSKKLGEIPIPKDTFELDLQINEGYQAYSAELLRLALLAMTGLAAVWIKVFVPGDVHLILPMWSRIAFLVSFAVFSGAAGAALFHRYAAADSLAYQLTALRRRVRNRPANESHPSDSDLAARQEAERDKLFTRSEILLQSGVALLLAGVMCFGVSLAGMMF